MFDFGFFVANPEFSADGQSLYFVATPDGVPNIYRMALDGSVNRMTNVLSGVSGITPLTPAMSAAANGTALVFTVFENDRYTIYATDTTRPSTIGAIATDSTSAAVLPPANRRPDTVSRVLQTPTAGLPQPRPYEVEDYRAQLSLDAISQPTIGVGADQFGTYAAGGISFVFSDMLGDHMLGATVQSTSRIEETGAAVMYLNRKQRWNWGASIEHLPFSTGAFAQGTALIDGQSVFVQQTERLTQLNSSVSALAQYPFSRVQRVEFSAGVRRIGFDSKLETQFFSPTTGQLLGEDSQDLPTPDALNLGEFTTALVYDSSIFGATSPILGRSYRFEYTQLAGSLNYGGLLADYRGADLLVARVLPDTSSITCA